MKHKTQKMLGMIVATVAVMSLSACGAQNQQATSSSKQSTSSQSSSSSAKESASHEVSSQKQSEQKKVTARPVANLDQIKQGNFSSLQGQWQLVASSVNHEDGNGQQAYERGDSSMKLYVNQNTISDGSVVLQGKTIASDTANQPAAYKDDGKTLNVSFSNQDAVAINHNIIFIPRGVDSGVKIDGKSIGTKQNLIQIWQSGPGHYSVYAQTSTDSQAAVPTKLNVRDINMNNFSSLVGTWKNSTNGKAITVTNQIQVKPANSHYDGLMGAITDGPKDSDGDPEIIRGGNIQDGWMFAAIGNFANLPGAFDPIAIVPAGVKMAADDNSDSTKDRLIVNAGQDGYAKAAYYRVK